MMHGDALSPFATLPSFMAFLDGRPDHERWELVTGVPIMMNPPKFGHQRIASNLERALNDRLEVVRPSWRAYREVGVLINEQNRYEPEIAVVDEDIDPDTRHTDRVYGIVEVTSASDMKRTDGGTVMGDKVERYRRHPSITFIIVVDQEQAHVVVHARDINALWVTATFDALEDMLVIPDMGDVCTLGDLYKGAGPTRRTERLIR